MERGEGRDQGCCKSGDEQHLDARRILGTEGELGATGRSFELVNVLDGKGVLMAKKDKKAGRKVVFILDMSTLAPRAAPEPDRERTRIGEEQLTFMQLLCIIIPWHCY